ncbi:hypothetical protein [Rhodoferax sp.]|uniref:hypothetical protein n=1 Tax=Rhodoferax sp. TaxID=50421 RepID=UPI002764312A|nr:hypothetical protein [Rhodoferax sp.]
MAYKRLVSPGGGALTPYVQPATSLTKWVKPVTAVVPWNKPITSLATRIQPVTSLAPWVKATTSLAVRVEPVRAVVRATSSTTPAPPKQRSQRAKSAQATPFAPVPESLLNHPQYVGARTSKAAYPRWLWGLLEDRPQDASQVAHDDPGRYGGEGYRYDTRSPAELIKAGAFTGRGQSLNITEHQAGHTLKSALVSLATERSGSEIIRGAHKEPGFTYHVKGLGKHNTFDVTDFYRPGFWAASAVDQREVVTTHVGLSQVHSVEDHARRQTILHPFTPITGVATKNLIHNWDE